MKIPFLVQFGVGSASPNRRPDSRKSTILTIALMAGFFVLACVKEGFAYAGIAMLFIIALAVELRLFLTTLIYLRDFLSRRAVRAPIGSIVILAVVAILLHALSPVSLSMASKIAAAIAVVVFVVMGLFGVRSEAP